MTSPAPSRSTRCKRQLIIEGEDVSSTDVANGSAQKRQRSRRNEHTTPSIVPISELPVSAREQGSGHFTGAHDFVISNLAMTDGRQQAGETSNKALEWLAGNVIPGAEFDSSERDPPPRCHPQTRLALRNKVLVWLRDPERETKILWLHGPAGVGKSAIAQTLTESENASKTLGAALFFSRPNHRDDLMKALPSIAYQLAVNFPRYQDYIREQMVANPRLLEKGMAEQFNKLIVQPFTSGNIFAGSKVLSIFLDGLDECQGEAAQREIIKLISTFVHKYPTAPLVWVISSRLEPHLQVAFSTESAKYNCSKEYIPVDSEEACRDVERYLQTVFENIRQRYPYSIPSTHQWPTGSQFLKLLSASLGLFVFPATIARFIDDERVGDPVSQLDLVLAMLDKLDLTAMDENPFAALDALYSQILASVPEPVLNVTRRILGYVLFQARQDAGLYRIFINACNLLNLKQNVAYGALQKLHSVVQVPPPESADSASLCFYHASFTDYLLDPRRSQRFWINLGQVYGDVLLCCTRILQQAKTEQSLPVSNISLSWPGGGSAEAMSDLFDHAKQWWCLLIVPESYRRVYRIRSCQARPRGHVSLCRECMQPISNQVHFPGSLKISQFFDVLRQVDFSRLYHGYFCSQDEQWERYVYFLRWIFDLGWHPEIKGRSPVETHSLSDVDMNRVMVDRIDYPPRIYRMEGIWFVDASPHASVEDVRNFDGKEALKDRLWLQQTLNPSSVCAIWGTEPDKRCLIVECSRLLSDDEYFDYEMFLLPYV